MNLLNNPEKRKWMIVVTIFIAIICNYLDRQLLSILKPTIKAAFDMNDDGYAFIMQASAPCMLSSMTDFYVTAAGLNITETTLAGFDRYDDAGMPEWVRIRDAVQYAATIDEFVERLNKGNNGGYALSHNGCHGCTGSTELREAKQSKDHDRIQNDICDGTAKL